MNPRRCFADLIRKAGGLPEEEQIQMAVFTAKPIKRGNRIFAYLQDARGDAWVAKIAFPADKLLEREYMVLRELAGSHSETIADAVPLRVSYRSPILLQELRTGNNLTELIRKSISTTKSENFLFSICERCVDWLSIFHDGSFQEKEQSPEQKIPFGMVHGDFKPSNILFATNGRMTVIDWELFQYRESQWIDIFHFITYLALTGKDKNRLANFYNAFDGDGFINELIRYLFVRYCNNRGLSIDERQADYLRYLEFILNRRSALGISNDVYFAVEIRDSLLRQAKPLKLFNMG